MTEFLKANSATISGILLILVTISSSAVGFCWRYSKRWLLYFVLLTLILSAALFWSAFEEIARQEAELLALGVYVVAVVGGFAYGAAPDRPTWGRRR